MKHLVFVYGTLLSGHGNYEYLLAGRSRFVARGTINGGKLYHLGGFPGLKLEGNTQVHGEVYEVSDEVFLDLDRLEGYRPSDPTRGLYNRERVEFVSDDMEINVEAWTYTYNGNINHRYVIESGDWNEVETKRWRKEHTL